jgi:hypothetical protein
MRATARGCLVALAIICALLLSPNLASADGLTGSVGITWLFPDTSTTYATDTIGAGSSLSCPGASPICAGYIDEGTQTFSVGASTISYDASGWYSTPYYGYGESATFNGFDFTGLTFISGGPLTSFTLLTDIAGLTDSDVTFGSSFIEVNLQGLPVNGYFTLELNPSVGTPVPEPSSLALLAAGFFLLALVGVSCRKAVA